MKNVCKHCGKRRGSRRCPALGGEICSRCCGENRLVRIVCPPTCVHLERNEKFQRDRQYSRYHTAWMKINADLLDRIEDFYLFINLELAIFFAIKEHGKVSDAEILSALSHVHTNLSPIELITSPPSSLARRLIDVIGSMIEDLSARDRIREDLTRIQKIIDLLHDPGNPRAFLQGFGTHMEELDVPRDNEGEPSGLILSPDDLD